MFCTLHKQNKLNFLAKWVPCPKQTHGLPQLPRVVGIDICFFVAIRIQMSGGGCRYYANYKMLK